MKKWIPSLLFSTLFMGCAETQTVTFDAPLSQQIATKVDDISWTPITVPSEIKFQIDKSNQQLLDKHSASSVASFSLPGNKGTLAITLESFVASDTSFYVPNVMVFGSNNEIVYQQTFKQFEYIPAKLLDNDKFVLAFNVIPNMTGDDLKLLIYTTKTNLQGETPILHPAKAFAIAKSTVQPQIPDPLAKHVAYGSFLLTIDSNEIVNQRVSSNIENMPTGVDLESFYQNNIKKAVDNTDIPKALSLLEEAKELNVKGAEQAFVDAVNSNK